MAHGIHFLRAPNAMKSDFRIGYLYDNDACLP